jgi:hypothetical protein
MMSQVFSAWSHRCASPLFAAGLFSSGYAPVSSAGAVLGMVTFAVIAITGNEN